jgi:hypothetical protein
MAYNGFAPGVFRGQPANPTNPRDPCSLAGFGSKRTFDITADERQSVHSIALRIAKGPRRRKAKIGAGVERQTQRGYVRVQAVIGHNGFRDEVGALRLDARIDMQKNYSEKAASI